MAEDTAAHGTELVSIDTPEAAIEALRGNALPEIEDPETVANNIMERILASTSPDEVLGGNSAVAAQDVIGRAFMLHSVRLLKSRFEEGPGVFAVLDAEFADDGERAAVTTSAKNIMAQAVQLWRLDALPRAVTIRKSENQTASGFHVYWLEAA